MLQLGSLGVALEFWACQDVDGSEEADMTSQG